MPVIPTFTPAQAPDTTTNLNQQAQANESNWMTQAQNRAQSAQTFQNQQQVFQAALPALQAKGQADQMMAQSEIAQAQITQKLRADAATTAPQALAEFLDAGNTALGDDGNPDYQGLYNNYSALQAKYANLALLPETKPLYDQIESAKKAAYDMSFQHTAAEMTLDRLKYGSTLKLDNTIAGQDNAATLATTTKPAIAQTETANQNRTKAFTDISAQRDNLSQMGYSIANMSKDVGAEQAGVGGSGPIMGSSIAGLVRPTVNQVQSDIGDFANRIMSTVKNIRNVNEFNAVTSSIPRATDLPEVQNEKIQKLQAVTQVLSQRNDLKEQLLRANPDMDPDQADQKASQQIPFPASVMGGGAGSGGAPADQQAIQWAQAHPNDPRSAQILKVNGVP